MSEIRVKTMEHDELRIYRRFELVKIAFAQALRDQAIPGRPCDGADDIGKDCVVHVDAVLAAMDQTPDTGPPAPIIRRVRQEIETELARERMGFSQNPALDEKTSLFRHEFERGMLRAIDIVGAMEKAGETAPPAEEIERPARGLTGEPFDGLRKNAATWKAPDIKPPTDQQSILSRLRAEIQDRLDADAKVYADNPTTVVRVSGFRDGGSDRSRHILEMIDAAMEKPGEAENA